MEGGGQYDARVHGPRACRSAGGLPRGATGTRSVSPSAGHLGRRAPVLRSVGVGQDVLARGDTWAAADRDGPAASHPRSELGLRAPGNGTGQHWPGAGRTLPAAGAGSHRPFGRCPGGAEAAHPRGRARSGDAGGRAPAGPDRGPWGIRRTGRTARAPGQFRARGAPGQKISAQPALLRFGARISEEGGADVPATWAHARW